MKEKRYFIYYIQQPIIRVKQQINFFSYTTKYMLIDNSNVYYSSISGLANFMLL